MATRGELGSWDEERWPTRSMGAVREAELARCLEILGVGQTFWLGYQDGGCGAVDQRSAVERICEVLDGLQPDAVLTFGPDGMTGHPDHRAVSSWTAGAFRRAARRGSRLYHWTTTSEWASEFVPLFNL